MQWESRAPVRLFCAALVAVTAGCVRPPAPAPPPEHHGKTVRVRCPGAEAAALVQANARGWAARQQARVEVVAYDATRGPGEAPADVWVLPPAELPRWAAAGRLLPVPPSFRTTEAFAWEDLLPQYREQLLVWDRTAYGLPLVGDGPVCCYRTDRLTAPAARAAYRQKYGRDLGPPATWEEFADIAEFFTARDGPALPPLPADESRLDRDFFAAAACYARRAVATDERGKSDPLEDIFSFHYDLRTGRPRIAGPGFVAALGLLQRLQKCRPPESTAEPETAFRDGRAVLCLAEAGWVAAFQQAPAVRDKFAVCPVPAAGHYYAFATGARQEAPGGNRVPYLGAAGWLAVVPTDASEPAAAFDLLADLAGPVTSRQIVIDPRWGGGPTRRDHLRGAVRWDGFDLDAAGTRALKDALETDVLHPRIRNPAFRLRTPDAAERQRVLLDAVRAALSRGEDAAAALSAAARRWEEMDRARGDAALADYRVSVGLLAK